MRTGSIENTAKYLAKKASSALKTCPERVASSARLKGVSGSEAQRNEKSQDLNNQLFKIIDDTFERKIKTNQKPILEKKEFLALIKRVIPNINIVLKYRKDNHFDGFTELIYDKADKTVIGIALNMTKALKKGENCDIARHEMRHIFDYVTQPKLASRNNTGYLFGKLENYTAGIDSKHNDFYTDELYGSYDFKTEQKMTNFVKKSVAQHFAKLKTPVYEKIELLQNWRASLKSELNAYTDEAHFISTEDDLADNLDEFVEDYAYRQKIQILGQLLEKEIASVRKIHAKKYGQKQATA